jgi:hypothetical protein
MNEIRTTPGSRFSAITLESVRRGLAYIAIVVVAAVAAGVALSAPRPAAPPLAGTTLEGNGLALAELRGKPVVINVWSSW